LRESGAYWYFSATTFTLLRALLPLVREFCSGRVLDAGAGGLHGRRLLEPYSCEYVSVDIADTGQHGELDLIADVQDLTAIDDMQFDCVYCSQVLEHIPRPDSALREFFRVLKPGGYVLVSAPHLSALHEEPHDYYRYTQHGLRYQLESSGFEVVKMCSAGGLMTFIAHPFSYVLNSVFWRLPVIRWLFWLINLIVLVLPPSALDHLLCTNRKWPTNIIAVGRKP
ncbi:MAG: class I SAM-dependent methyltransferase, partial [Gammaproteobacteria bacterium]|nr:class I SAM-dependent methyltransferase [Gammaproteobacteria bacterium]